MELDLTSLGILRQKYIGRVVGLVGLAVRFLYRAGSHLESALRASAAIRRIKPVTPFSIEGAEKIAVIATHNPSEDFKLFLASLRCNGYKILGYAYSPCSHVFEKEDCVFYREVDFGRDFLAYKHACEVLAAKAFGIKRLLFANDSFFVAPSIESVTEWFALAPAEWSGYSMNMRLHFHVGSFLFQVQGRALLETFNFMKRYRPMNTRYHVINFGETALSAHLIYSGFTPAVYVYDTGILDEYRILLARGIAKGEDWALEFYDQLRRHGPYCLTNNVWYNAGQIARFLESSNLSTRIGFYLFKDGRVPVLKRDVFYRGGANSFFSAPDIPTTVASAAWSAIHGRSRYMRSISRIRRFLELLDD